MCGIAGIVHREPQREVDRARLEAMRDQLAHRGPDDRGAWISGPVGLGHRRLSIVDLEGGHQPMASADGNLCIVFNGEIYNHTQLREQLESEGARYRTRSDTETILQLYQRHGPACVALLEGMFAFAIWDQRARSLFLARDRLGIKPLYYSLDERELLFASEIKSILAAKAERPAFNEAVLPDYLGSRFVATDETFFRGVRKLQPGHVLRWTRERGLEERRYWQLPARLDESTASLEERAAEVREALTAAVKSHLMSDVPLGVFLSGGLDSSGLAALVAGMIAEPVRTFSVGFNEAEANELAYARLVAGAIKSRHHEVVVSAEEFFSTLPRLIWHEDEPIAFPSSVPLYFVSRLAREHVKVVLTGEGADELFLGYNRYRVTAWNERLAGLMGSWVPGDFRPGFRWLTRKMPARLRRYAERSFLVMPPGPRSMFLENFSVFNEPLREQLLADVENRLARDPHAVALARYQEGPGGSLERMSRADLQTYLVELLMKQDQMSMAASVESRVPFLDHRFVERMAAIPASYKLRGFRGKAVLRAALAGLVPPAILRRRKLGFPVPLGRWLRGPFWPLVQDLLLSPRARARAHLRRPVVEQLAFEHRAGRRDHGDKLWLLINLELWERIFIDGDRPVALAKAA